MSDYKFYIYGSRGTYPVCGDEYSLFGGQTSCYILKKDKHAIIIDCGTGLYEAEDLISDCEIIDVLITHVHYDHILGLLKSYVFPRKCDVTFYGTFSKWGEKNILKEFFNKPFWPIQMFNYKTIEIENKGNIYQLKDGFSFKAFYSKHPDYTSAYSIEFDNKKICILSDFFIDDIENLDFINNAEILLYDGTFDSNEYVEYYDWGHSTYLLGCDVAKKYNIKQLLITHHNPSHTDKKLLEMEEDCKKIYPNSRFVRFKDEFIL